MNKGSLVMFRSRCNPPYPMRIEDTRMDSMGINKEYKIDGKWWFESSLMPYSEWKNQQRTAPERGEGRDDGT